MIEHVQRILTGLASMFQRLPDRYRDDALQEARLAILARLDCDPSLADCKPGYFRWDAQHAIARARNQADVVRVSRAARRSKGRAVCVELDERNERTEMPQVIESMILREFVASLAPRERAFVLDVMADPGLTLVERSQKLGVGLNTAKRAKERAKETYRGFHAEH